jgi:5-formyltetrahydrofolate cyclo-ligase
VAAARRVARNAARVVRLRPGLRIAVYAPLPDELDVQPLVTLARERGCRIYLPRLTDRRRARMRFVEATGPLRRNRLGILEPAAARPVSARWLDVVFVPLVGFDPSGMRLGMGAGYYDRAFAYRRVRTTWRKPRLIGLAYSLQRVASLTPAEHDVLLDTIVTDEEVLQCRIGC